LAGNCKTKSDFMYVLSEDLLKMGKEKADYICYLLLTHKDKRAIAIARQYFNKINENEPEPKKIGDFTCDYIDRLLKEPNTFYQWEKSIDPNPEISKFIIGNFPKSHKEVGHIKITGESGNEFTGVGCIYIIYDINYAVLLSIDERNQVCYSVWHNEAMEYLVKPENV
jgi:hypothetical protein